MHIADQTHAASFSRFIDSEGESELDYSSNLPTAALLPTGKATGNKNGGASSA